MYSICPYHSLWSGNMDKNSANRRIMLISFIEVIDVMQWHSVASYTLVYFTML